MAEDTPPDRIFIPGRLPLIEIFRAMRGWIEQHAAAEGTTLDPAWYRDGPEDRPELYPEMKRSRAAAAAAAERPQPADGTERTDRSDLPDRAGRTGSSGPPESTPGETR